MRLGDFQELEDVGIAQKVGGVLDGLALCGKLEDGVLVFPGGKTKEEGGVLLAFQLSDGPVLTDGLLLVKAALQRIIDFQKLANDGPTQFVRQRRTNWINEIKLAEK